MASCPSGLSFTQTVRGTQYASEQITTLAQANGLTYSMGYSGVCWDDSMVELFFVNLKTEFYYRRVWPTMKRARMEVVKWVEDRYNCGRRHASTGKSHRSHLRCNT